MKIAYFSPLNPVPSGVSDYSEELLPYLAQHLDLELFVDGYEPTNRAITEAFPIYPFRGWTAGLKSRYDLALYHMGNHRVHAYAYQAMREWPGVVVWHDVALHHFFAEVTLAQTRPADYIREMGYCYGLEGLRIGRQVVAGQKTMPWYGYPLVHRVLDLNLGAIVHSHYARKVLLAAGPTAWVEKINHHVNWVLVERYGADRAEARRRLGLPADAFIGACPGLLTPAKRLDKLVGAWVRLRRRFGEALLLLVGEVQVGYNVRELVEQAKVPEVVRMVGRVSLEDFHRYIAAADVGVSLRWPTAGETSGSVLRAMAAGKPVVVSDVGWFAELPEDCCAKVGVGEGEEELLAAYLERLAEDETLRRVMGTNAAAYARREHSLEASARRYAEFIRQVVNEAEARCAPTADSV